MPGADDLCRRWCGLLAALPTAYPGLPVQRCWAHKIRNVLGKVRVGDKPGVKADLHTIMNATTLPQRRAWFTGRKVKECSSGMLATCQKMVCRFLTRFTRKIPVRIQFGRCNQCRDRARDCG